MKSFLELAESRYSVRKFENRPIEEEKLQAILRAAKAAPTARNCQPQRIFVIKSEEARKNLAEVCPCTFDAPVILAVCYDKRRAAEGRLYPGYVFGETDAAIVCSSMMFEAQDLGLGSCWVGWFVEKEVKQALRLPEEVFVCDLLPIGYPAADAAPGKGHFQCRPDEEMVETL